MYWNRITKIGSYSIFYYVKQKFILSEPKHRLDSFFTHLQKNDVTIEQPSYQFTPISKHL